MKSKLKLTSGPVVGEVEIALPCVAAEEEGPILNHPIIMTETGFGHGNIFRSQKREDEVLVVFLRQKGHKSEQR